MKHYIGCKTVKAEPMSRAEFLIRKGQEPTGPDMFEPGYLVVYPDAYESWSPKDVFERAYLTICDDDNEKTGVSISQRMVDEFISYVETQTVGEKNTVVRCVLRNGFEIIESSSCVDPKNYDETIGHEICMNKIKDKIWGLLGFLLQTAWHGIR